MPGLTAGARATIYEPQALQLSQFDTRRGVPAAIATHPLIHQFDSETLFFDVFSISPNTVVAMGPPLDGCEPKVTISVASGGGLRARTHRHRIPQQFTTRTVFAGDGAGERGAIALEANGVRHTAVVNADRSSLLANRRVVVTVSRDNPLVWIRDWAEFYVRWHSADAILIYDNDSTTYGPDALIAALADIDGLAEVVIVPWRFPYGAGGPAPGEPALDNFCQTGALDHARRCLCRKSRSVLNVDVDELVVTEGTSIFERVERSRQAVLLFHGIWAEAAGVTSPQRLGTVRHRDCVFAWRDQLEALAAGRLAPLCRSKWACVPSRCSEQVEWGIHEIYAATPWARLLRRFWLGRDTSVAYRHCRQINTGWKVERWRTSDDFASRCAVDPTMSAAMLRVFGPPLAAV